MKEKDIEKNADKQTDADQTQIIDRTIDRPRQTVP